MIALYWYIMLNVFDQIQFYNTMQILNKTTKIFPEFNLNFFATIFGSISNPIYDTKH
jgi:hypothetical protein